MNSASDQEIVLIAGIAAVLASLVLFVNTRRFLKAADETQGEVVGHGVADGSSFSDKTSTATIRFLVNGKEYIFAAKIMSKNKYYVGKKVDVVYDPADPFHASIKRVWHLYFMEIVCASVGLTMLFAAVTRY